MHYRFASLLIAALLPLLLFHWFVPLPQGQIDFWMLWIIAMVAVGLPLLYAEIGLAHRSQRIPVQGIQALTRQADTSQVWRSYSWLTVILALIIVALSSDAISVHLLNAMGEVGIDIDIPAYALASGMVVIAGILSLLGSSSLGIAVLLLTTAFIISVVNNITSFTLIMTATSIAEWSSAVVLALVSVGVGTGLYWFNNPKVTLEPHDVDNDQTKKMKLVATRSVLPIWLMQLVIGSIALLFSTDFSVEAVPSAAVILYALGIIATCAFLMHYASTQIATRFKRFGIWIATIFSIITVVVIVNVAQPQLLTTLLKIISILGALILAVFTGWQMKISHMRKSLNFKSEASYNLWRIMIRIVVPILIIVAIIGWLQSASF